MGIMVRSYRAPQIAARVQPGQFVEAALPPAAQTFLRRPFAVFDADPKAGTISLMIQEAGAGTRWLVAHPEAELDFLGPLGQPWRLPEKPAEALLIGGGVGAAPLLLLARALPDCQVVLGAQNLDQLVARAYFGEGANTHYCTDDGSFAHHGFVTDLSADLIAQGKVSQIYCCGPTPMLAAVATQAKQAKIACQVSLEAKMACGVGACLGCVVETRQGYRRVCADGPIFDAQDILW